MQPRHPRRRLLAAASSVGLAALAGCSGNSDGGDDSDDPEDDETAPANESGADGGNATGDAADDGTPPMPEPVDWTDEERGTVSVGPDGEFGFEPDAVRITSGTLIRWLWESDGHSVTPVDRPDGADWDGETDAHDGGHSYGFTFESPGTYEYVCESHEGPDMRGYVVVTDGER